MYIHLRKVWKGNSFMPAAYISGHEYSRMAHVNWTTNMSPSSVRTVIVVLGRLLCPVSQLNVFLDSLYTMLLNQAHLCASLNKISL